MKNAHHKKFASKPKVKLHEDMIHSSSFNLVHSALSLSLSLSSVHVDLPLSPLLLGLVMKAFRGNRVSPGMSKLDTARVARDLLASFLLGHCTVRHHHGHVCVCICVCVCAQKKHHYTKDTYYTEYEHHDTSRELTQDCQFQVLQIRHVPGTLALFSMYTLSQP